MFWGVKKQKENTNYMPFIFLYGLREFAVLAAVLIFGSVGIGMWLPRAFPSGGWFTAIVLILFALLVQITPRFSKQ